MARFPSGTPYASPTHCYDEMIDPEQLLRRLAYGKAAPMLRPYQRMNGLFFGRLLDAMANAHVVLVKTARCEETVRKTARILRRELPPEAFGLAVDFDPGSGEWNLLVFNEVPIGLRTIRIREQGDVWIGPREVARVLKVTPSHAARIIDRTGVRQRRTGGCLERQIRQQDLVILANRKGRWRKRTRKAA